MLKKRLVGVITVKGGWAVQSMGYRRYLPLGHPEYLAENFDRWGADEILVLCIDRSRHNLGPDFTLLHRLSALGLSTPLTFGGGIRTVGDAGDIIRAGAERICIDQALGDSQEARAMSALIGAQAIIGVLPLSYGKTSLQLLNYLTGQSTPLARQSLSLFTGRVVSEALIVDWRGEGHRNGFDMQLIDHFPDRLVPIIAFGGISEPSQVNRLLNNEQIVAVGVGNFLAYREHAIQLLKRSVKGDCIRAERFAGNSR